MNQQPWGKPFIVTQQPQRSWSPWRGSHGGGGGVTGGGLMGQSPLLSLEQAGELAGRGGSSAIGRGHEEEAAVAAAVPLSVGPRPPVRGLHSAVASQLVPRGTWRHLVSVSTWAGTVGGRGLLSSAPAGADEAADARLQGVTGAVTPGWEEPGWEEPQNNQRFPKRRTRPDSLLFLTRGCDVVVRGGGFTGVGGVALRRLAGGWGRGLPPLGRPGRVGGVHAGPRAAAQLQPPHVAHHGGGVERLLRREKER